MARDPLIDSFMTCATVCVCTLVWMQCIYCLMYMYVHFVHLCEILQMYIHNRVIQSCIIVYTCMYSGISDSNYNGHTRGEMSEGKGEIPFLYTWKPAHELHETQYISHRADIYVCFGCVCQNNPPFQSSPCI